MTTPDISITLSTDNLSDMCFGRFVRIADLIASDTIDNPKRAIAKLRMIITSLPKRYGPLHVHLHYRIEQLKQLS